VSRPLGSTPTPASSGFTATTGRSAGEHRIGTQCLRLLPRHAPSHSPHDQAVVSAFAFSRSVQEPQTRLTPPPRRAPPGQYAGTRQAHLGGRSNSPDFDASCTCYDASTANTQTVRVLLERLPDPHLTRSSRAFSLTLTTTVFSQRRSGRFSACPRRPTLEGQRSPISRTAPPMKSASYMTPPSAFVTHAAPASITSSMRPSHPSGLLLNAPCHARAPATRWPQKTGRPETALPRLSLSTIMSPAPRPRTKLRLDPRAATTAPTPTSRDPPA